MDNEFQKLFSDKKSESEQDEFKVKMKRKLAKLEKEASRHLKQIEEQFGNMTVLPENADFYNKIRQDLEEEIKCGKLIVEDKLRYYELMEEELGADDDLYIDYFTSKRIQIVNTIGDYEVNVKNKIDEINKKLDDTIPKEHSLNSEKKEPEDVITVDHRLSRNDNEKSILSRIGRRITHSIIKQNSKKEHDGIENPKDCAKH